MHNLKLNEQKVWRGTHLGVPFKIVNWHMTSIEAAWNYYVYLHESKCKNFESLWLEDRLVQFAPGCPIRVTHDYYGVPIFSEIELHGGITWYNKLGHSVGHRCVEVGCDYQQPWDMENGGTNLDLVCQDVQRTCELVKELILK